MDEMVGEALYRVFASAIVVNFVGFRAGKGVAIGRLDLGASIAQSNTTGHADALDDGALGVCVRQGGNRRH